MIKKLSSPLSLLPAIMLAIILFVPWQISTASGSERDSIEDPVGETRSLALTVLIRQQNQNKEQEKKGQQEQASVDAKKTRAVNESCDGALNIVPTGSMSFARKRRPAQSETKTDTRTDSKPESKNETKNKTKSEPKPAERQTGDRR
jgi:hypothetical protein